MPTVDELISKSLDEIEAMTEEFNKGKVSEGTDVSKSQNDEDLSPDDVSDDAPEEDTPEEGNDEDADQDSDDADTSDEDNDSDTEGEEDSDEDGEDGDEDTEKSLESELRSNDSVRKALEVSEFLDNLVKGISATISKHDEGLNKSLETSQKSQEMLAKSFYGIVKSQRAIMDGQAQLAKSVRTLNKRLKTLEEKPMVRKSVASAQPINKSFDASVGNTAKPDNTLSKSQISAKLTEAFESGKGDLLTDVLAFDATGDVNALSATAKNIIGL